MKIWLALWRYAPLVVAAAMVPVPFAITGAVPWVFPLALAASGIAMRHGSRAWVDWRAARLDHLLRRAPAAQRGVLRARAIDAWEAQTAMRLRFGLADAVTDPDDDPWALADGVHFALSSSDGEAPETAADLPVRSTKARATFLLR